jgi:diguanylate cyclase (GGDEF)-like protein/PAS domain S-box-containing protein
MSDNDTINLEDICALNQLAGYTTDMVYRLRYDTMRYEYISPSVEKLLGFSPEELKHINFRSLILETRLVSEDLRPVTDFQGLESNRKQGKTLKWQADYRIRTKDGRTLWVADVSYPWFDESGAMIGSIGTLRDITERVQAEDAYLLENLRLHTMDGVTGLPLRNQFFERLETELKRQRRQHNEVGVMIISIERYAEFSRDHGEDAATHLLQHIIQIIRHTMRETDVLARVDEDSFGLCLCDTSLQSAFALAERIRDQVTTSVFRTPKGSLYPCSINLGLSGSRFDEKRSASELFKTAENRLFIARHSGNTLANLPHDSVAMH